MAVLAAISYDPATAVTKATSATLAMTALDTTNLRLTFTVPSSGRVWVQMVGTIHGATTFPQILFGVLQGATVRARVAPQCVMGGTALATTFVNAAALIPAYSDHYPEAPVQPWLAEGADADAVLGYVAGLSAQFPQTVPLLSSREASVAGKAR